MRVSAAGPSLSLRTWLAPLGSTGVEAAAGMSEFQVTIRRASESVWTVFEVTVAREFRRDRNGARVRCARDGWCRIMTTPVQGPDDSLEEAAMNMTNTNRSARGCVLAALAALAMPSLAACGDDATAEPATTSAETVEQYGARMDVECPGSDPGFDPFLAEHPTPTAADWASFLPTPLKLVSDMRDCIAASGPPSVIADDVDAVVAAFDVVVTDFEKALAAATADDLATTEEWITRMHDIDQPKIDEAIAEVGVG